jgi:hypothetical protein
VTWVETRNVPLAELARFPGNARRGNTEEIRASLRRNGQYRALVVRDTGDGLVILAGNHTRDAIEAEHHTVARCEIVTCTDDEATRINLADNRVAEKGAGYDDEALAELLASLNDDFDGSGWEADDLDDLLASLEQMPVLPPQPTSAAYAETPEQLAEREERFAEATPRQSFGIREVVLVLPQDDYDELQGLIGAARRATSSETTASEAVLAGMRAAARLISSCSGSDDCAWCQ